MSCAVSSYSKIGSADADNALNRGYTKYATSGVDGLGSPEGVLERLPSPPGTSESIPAALLPSPLMPSLDLLPPLELQDAPLLQPPQAPTLPHLCRLPKSTSNLVTTLDPVQDLRPLRSINIPPLSPLLSSPPMASKQAKPKRKARAAIKPRVTTPNTCKSISRPDAEAGTDKTSPKRRRTVTQNGQNSQSVPESQATTSEVTTKRTPKPRPRRNAKLQDENADPSLNASSSSAGPKSRPKRSSASHTASTHSNDSDASFKLSDGAGGSSSPAVATWHPTAPSAPLTRRRSMPAGGVRETRDLDRAPDEGPRRRRNVRFSFGV